MASVADRWQDVLGELRQCDYRAEADKVVLLLDLALGAAKASGQDSTPGSVLQQLTQARQLYELDKHASWKIVERVLADIDDAQALLMLMSAPPADEVEDQEATTAAAAGMHRDRSRGRRDAVGAVDEGFPVPLHLVPRRPRTSRGTPAPAEGAAAGAAGYHTALGLTGVPAYQQQQAAHGTHIPGYHQHSHYNPHQGSAHLYAQGLGRPGFSQGFGSHMSHHLGSLPIAQDAARVQHRDAGYGLGPGGGWGSVAGYSSHAPVSDLAPAAAAGAGAPTAAAAGDQRAGLVAALSELLEKATAGDSGAAKTLSEVVAAAAQRPGGQEQLLPLLHEAQQQQQQRRQQQQQHIHLQSLSAGVPSNPQGLPFVGFGDLQSALQHSRKPLPDSLKALLANLGMQESTNSNLQAQAAAAAIVRSKTPVVGMKRSASAAGLQDAAAAAGLPAPAQRQSGAAAAAASNLLQQLMQQRSSEPDGVGSDGNRSSAAAVIEALGLPFDHNKAKMIEHISAMLRQRGVQNEAQVSAFISALPAAMTAAATAAAAGRPGQQQLADVLLSMDEAAVVKATEAAVAAALQAPTAAGGTSGVPGVTTAPRQQMGGTSSVHSQNLGQHDAVTMVQSMLQQQPHMADLPPAKIEALATALVSAMSAAAGSGSLDKDMVQLLLQQAQQAVAAVQQVEARQAAGTSTAAFTPQGGSACNDVAAAAAAGGESVTAAGVQVSVPQSVEGNAGSSSNSGLTPLQSAAMALLKSAGAQVTMQQIFAAGEQQQQQQVEVCVVLPPSGPQREMVEQLLPKLGLPNLKVTRDAAAAAAPALTKPEQHSSAAAPAAATAEAGSGSVLNLVKLHSELSAMMLLSEPGSVRHRSIRATLELLEGSEVFMQEVQHHETTAAASGSSTAAKQQVPAKVRFVTRPRPAALDMSTVQGPAAAAADLGAAPPHSTHAGLAALSAQLLVQLSHLRHIRGQVEIQAKQGADRIAAAAAASGAQGPVSGKTGNAPAATAAPTAAPPPPAAVAVAAQGSSGAPRVSGSGGGAAPSQGGVAPSQGVAAPSQGLASTAASGSKPQALSAAPVGSKGLAAPGGMQPSGGGLAPAGSGGLASASSVNPAATTSGLSTLISSLTAGQTGGPGGLNATSLASLLQQHLGNAAAAAAAGSSAAVANLLAAVTSEPADAVAAAALQPPTSLAPIKTGQQLLQSLTSAAPAAASSSPTDQQQRIQWKGAVLAPYPAAAGSSGSGTPKLLQLFALTADLPLDVAALLPEVLVVTAKQPRNEVVVNIKRHDPLIMSPAPSCTPEHLDVLLSLSRTKIALLVELPKHDLVLCPEAAAAALTGGAAVVVGVLLPRRQQEQQTLSGAGSASAAQAAAAAAAEGKLAVAAAADDDGNEGAADTAGDAHNDTAAAVSTATAGGGDGADDAAASASPPGGAGQEEDPLTTSSAAPAAAFTPGDAPAAAVTAAGDNHAEQQPAAAHVMGHEFAAAATVQGGQMNGVAAAAPAGVSVHDAAPDIDGVRVQAAVNKQAGTPLDGGPLAAVSQD